MTPTPEEQLDAFRQLVVEINAARDELPAEHLELLADALVADEVDVSMLPPRVTEPAQRMRGLLDLVQHGRRWARMAALDLTEANEVEPLETLSDDELVRELERRRKYRPLR